MATKIITVEATPPSESTGADYNKGAPLNAAEFDQNIVNLRAAVDRKASLNNPTFTGTVTLPSTTSIGDVSSTELQYLNSVTSNVQDQINAKAPINNPTFTGTVTLSTGTANGVLYLNGSKQVTSGSGLVFNSSGNVGIGTSSPSQKLHVYGGAALTMARVEATTDSAYLNLRTSNRSYNIFSEYSTSGLVFYDVTGGSERMRLDSSGKLLVGRTSTSGYTQTGIQLEPSGHIQMHRDGIGNYISFQYNPTSSTVGSISTNGTTTAYNTSSDYRLKEDYQPVADAITRLNQLKPVNFAWKINGERCDGFLAHELQEVIPEAATGHKDEMRTEEYEITPKVEATFDEEGNELTPAVEAVMGEREVPVYQGIDQSKIVPLLTAALQEAVAKIESLTQRIEALEYTKQGE